MGSRFIGLHKILYIFELMEKRIVLKKGNINWVFPKEQKGYEIVHFKGTEDFETVPSRNGGK
jgi:hypothetical protein